MNLIVCKRWAPKWKFPEPCTCSFIPVEPVQGLALLQYVAFVGCTDIVGGTHPLALACVLAQEMSLFAS